MCDCVCVSVFTLGFPVQPSLLLVKMATLRPLSDCHWDVIYNYGVCVCVYVWAVVVFVFKYINVVSIVVVVVVVNRMHFNEKKNEKSEFFREFFK